MKLYADFGPRRARQIIADLVSLAILALAIVAGITVYGAIAAVGRAFARVEEAGTGFQGTMGELGDSLGGVPLVGNGVRELFASAAGAGGSLADAGRTGQAVIESIAVGAGLGVALVPIAVLLLAWLWPRVRFVRRAGATRALLALDDGPALLALRALDDADARELAAISPHPVRAWLAQESQVVQRLAALEAREAGIRLPEASAATAAPTR
ncbi:MAG: hypothetical protein ACTHMQ_09585 [Protaetiibacter sp.]